MADLLFPVFDVPQVSIQTKTEEKKYKRSLAWDMEKGDFIVDGANRIVESKGREAYQTWCIKAVQTERYTCLAYPGAIGTEMEESMKQPTQEATKSHVERTISEALLVNPKTEYVRDFVFTWEADKVRCNFTVKGKDLEEFTLSIAIYNN